MPIEIRELVIKTSIHEGDQAQVASSGSGDKSGTGDQNAVIAACVEQVLAILKDKAER